MDTSLSHPAALCGWPGALGQKPLPRRLPFAWLRVPRRGAEMGGRPGRLVFVYLSSLLTAML